MDSEAKLSQQQLNRNNKILDIKEACSRREVLSHLRVDPLLSIEEVRNQLTEDFPKALPHLRRKKVDLLRSIEDLLVPTKMTTNGTHLVAVQGRNNENE